MERRGLPYLQRALRVNEYNTNDSKYWKNVAEEGGSPTHLDSCDYLNTSGGGRWVRILTMVSRWITVVLLPSSYCLHGSVFPDLPFYFDTISKPNACALCVALYTLKNIVKLASMISKDAE
eukprot:7427563-Ditylum_brightwellii.AAC.1